MPKSQKGFTLIEVLIALSIFALIAMVTSNMLYNALKTNEVIKSHGDRLHEVQIAAFTMENDIQQMIDKSLKPDEPAILGTKEHLAFTRLGMQNPLSLENISELTRVHYSYQEKNLLRNDRILLSEVKEIEFTYLDNNKKFTDHWPEEKKAQHLPKAILINIAFTNGKTLWFLFKVPSALGVDA